MPLRQDPDSDSDSNLRPDLDSGFESLKKRIFDKLNCERIYNCNHLHPTGKTRIIISAEHSARIYKLLKVKDVAFLSVGA